MLGRAQVCRRWSLKRRGSWEIEGEWKLRLFAFVNLGDLGLGFPPFLHLCLSLKRREREREREREDGFLNSGKKLNTF